MKSNLFNKHTHQKKEQSAQKPPQKDTYWDKEIEEMMQLGYSYEVAYAIVSKRKIQELFDKDVKINDGR